MQINHLTWRLSDSGLPRDGKWTCGSTGHDYPSMHHSLLHPCANEGGNCCGNAPYTPFVLRYESFFHSERALLVLAYEVSSLLTPFHDQSWHPGDLCSLTLHACSTRPTLVLEVLLQSLTSL